MSRLPGAALACLVLTASVNAQDQNPRTLPYDGFEVLCYALHSLKLQPITRIARADLGPETMIVVVGNPYVLGDIDRETGGLEKYRKTGGNLLVATDYKLERGDLSISISGQKITVPENAAYRGNPECPWLPLSQMHALLATLRKTDEQRDHPLFADLQQGIAANCPSAASTKSSECATLLKYPGGLSFNMIGSAKNAPPDGRVLFIAGHGMFMNGMMLQKDNDNFAFTVNAINWLRAGKGNKKRTRALLIVDGKIITDFDVNLSPPPPLPLPTAQKINRLLANLEDEGFFDRFPEALRNALRPERTIAVLFAIGTLILLLYGAKKFLDERHLQETMALTGAATSRFEREKLILTRRADLWEEARFLIREWFQVQFDVAPERWTHGAAFDLEVQGLGKTDPGLERRVGEVMALARAADPVQVTRRDFARLAQSLTLLHQAVNDNQLALLVEGKNIVVSCQLSANHSN
jgi:hypothetical protein